MTEKLIMVVCGAGTLTSVAAAQGIEEGLRERNISNFTMKVGKIDDIEGNKDNIDVLACSMNIREEYPFPVINVISFMTGDEEKQEEVINKIADILMSEK